MPRHARTPLWAEQSSEQKLETLRQLVLDLYRYQLGPAYAEIRRQLAAHQPADEDEARAIQRILRLMAEHANILNMNCEVGHITGSAVIVELSSRRTLLHYHRRLGRWLQVGGHADYETDPAQVALREAREETGLPDLAFYPPADRTEPIDYDVHTIPASGDQPAHLHLDFRYLLATRQPDALNPAAGESARFRWLSFAEALALGSTLDPALRRLLRKARDIITVEAPDSIDDRA